MRFGAFVTPNHRPDDSPTLALHRDLQLVENLEALGYDEAWFGEHCPPSAFIRQSGMNC